MEETGGASAYGASLAGGGFDFYKFIRQPQTIVRILSWIFALVVFASITTEGYINSVHSPEVKCIFNQNDSACQIFALVVFASITTEGYINSAHSPEVKCIFNQNDSACHYALGIGVIAFLACAAFLVLDVYVPFMSNAQERKYAVMADLGFSGAWSFLWFVCFCLLASQWAKTHDISGVPEDAARATVTFSFFSIATWGILTYFALGRFRRGVNEVTIPTYTEPPPDHNSPYPPTYAPTSYNPTTYTPTTYAAYPSSVPDMHQQPPFTPNPQPQGDAGYQPPNY